MAFTPATLDASALACLAPIIEDELRRHLLLSVRTHGGNAASRMAALKYVFTLLFDGGRCIEECREFFMFAAPIMRRVVVTYVASGEIALPGKLNLPQLECWLARLETFDPQCVRMIELRYFCGFSIKETAVLMQLSPASILFDLRFAKAWLRAYAGWSAVKWQ